MEKTSGANEQLAARRFASATCASATFHGTKLKIFGQLEGQIGLSRNLLFPAAIDLRSGTARPAYQSSDGSSLASAQERSQHSADRSAAAYILGRPLVRA